MKKRLFKILIVLSSAILLLVLIFFTNGLDQLLNLLANIDYLWIAAAFGCMATYWLMDSLIIQLITRSLFEEQRLRDSLKITMVGQFFNTITPFATGGQPAQAYVMVKDGVKAGHAASILIVRSILYQVTLALYTLTAVILKASFFSLRIPHVFALYIIGFLINATVITLYILSFYNGKAAKKLMMYIFRLLHKIRFIKNLDSLQKKLESEIASFTDGAVILKNNLAVLFQTLILQLIQFTFYFSIPYFIYHSIETGGVDFWSMVAAQSLVTMITLLIPSPGSTGGAEGTGYLFFSLFFKQGIIIPVILIWRIITYYTTVIFGGLVSAFAPEKPLKNPN